MPKMKTRKIVSKRFRITNHGKVMHRLQGARHLRRKKSKSRQRTQNRPQRVHSKRLARSIRHFLAT